MEDVSRKRCDVCVSRDGPERIVLLVSWVIVFIESKPFEFFLESCQNNCSGNGECLFRNSEWFCECDSEHFGSRCEYSRETNCGDKIDNDNGMTDTQKSLHFIIHFFESLQTV